MKWPKKFKVKVCDEYMLNFEMHHYYLNFGDIHNNAKFKKFENWWLYWQKLRKIKDAKDIKGIKIYDFERDFDSVINLYDKFKAHGSERTLQQFKSRFIAKAYDYSHNLYRTKLYLKIDLLSPSTTEDLIKQIGKIIKRQRKTPYIRERRSSRNFEPALSSKVKENYIRKEELWRYLEIYDYKEQGLSMSDIIKEMGKDSKDTNIRSIFHQDLKRAKKIIKNVELGVFPGKYQPKDKS